MPVIATRWAFILLSFINGIIFEISGDMWPDKNEEEPEWVKTERETFKTVRDKNGDGKMDLEEVKNWIMPPDYDHSEAETRHLIHESDSDKVCTHFGLGWGILFRRCFQNYCLFFPLWVFFVLHVLLVKFNSNSGKVLTNVAVKIYQN